MTHRRRNRTAWLLAAAFVVSQVNIGRLLRPLGSDVVRLQTTTDPDAFREVMQAWSPEQRAQYQRHLPPDTLHPVLYAAALIAMGRSLRRDAPAWARVASVLAPAASAACDLIENSYHGRFNADPDGITDHDARRSGRLTRTKWVLALGTAGVIGLHRLVRR